jgi:hypothetical protein
MLLFTKPAPQCESSADFENMPTYCARTNKAISSNNRVDTLAIVQYVLLP